MFFFVCVQNCLVTSTLSSQRRSRSWSHLLLMSISLGGMGIVSLRNPFADFILGKGDLRSMFCLIVFLIVFFVLAYLTNPTENSFRSYLTEQSFRHHLSRLDYNADDQASSATNRSHLPRNTSSSTTTSLFSVENPTPFHFANRTSIALRTPKHVFHSFAIFTIAAMAPLSKSPEGDTRDGGMISDSWYFGAFGKWWRGGVLEAWYQDVIARTKDEESWSSGILSIKRLDMFPEYNGPTFPPKNLPAHFARGPPPRLRNRERPTLRHNAIQRQRSSTPPPLPKSASLPMHTTRKPSSGADRSMCDRHSSQVQQQQPTQPPNDAPAARRGPATPSRPSSTLFEHSPLIAEVLRQITNTKASVLDIRTQLSECESAALQSRAVLQHEVDNHRERKRQEDASKFELKSRTKSLEDSKRVAETVKKEAEKKFKAVQLCRDGTTQRMDMLDKEILTMQQSLSEDRDFVLNHRSQVSEAEREITETLEAKRLEIKTTEDLLLVLNQRSRELEEKLASEKERLQVLRKESETLKENRGHPLDYSPRHYHYHQEETAWPSNTHTNNPSLSPSLPVLQHGDIWDQTLDGPNARQIYEEPQFIEDYHTLSNGQVSNLSNGLNSPTAVKDTQSLFPGQSFLPFDNVSTSMILNGQPNVEYLSTSKDGAKHSQFARDIVVPDGLSTLMEHGNAISRSFQSDSDPYVDREWRHQPSYPNHYQNDGVDARCSPATLSPTSLHGSSISNPDGRSFFESHFVPSQDRAQDLQAFDSPSMDLQHSTWIPTESETTTLLDSPGAEQQLKATDKGRPLRWFTGIGKERSTKGLNPDAKEFSICKPTTNLFNRGHSHYHNNHHLPTTTYDALNPNGLGSTTSSSSTSQSLLRAFAPSPAEREALQRALGGSTNASFERLPSLSDVGSIPASPTNAHAHARVVPPQHSGRDLGSLLPAWLQSLPRTRKVNFSPWDDEEPVNSKVESKESTGRRG